MNTVIEDKELDLELQELYIIASHWVADLDFFKKDIDFLKRLFSSTMTQVAQHESYAELVDLTQSINEIVRQHTQLRNNILSYRSMLNSYLRKADSFLDLNFIETHALLEREIGFIMSSFKGVKSRVYSLHNAEDVRYAKEHQVYHHLA